MQKTHIKLGLLIAMICLFLAAESVTGGTALAHNAQASGKFRPWFMNRPHISVRMLSNAAHHANHSYTGRAVISGVGFDACNSCAPATSSYSPCDTSCSSATSADTSCSSDPNCSTTTTTNTTTTTTTSTSYTTPSTSPSYTAPNTSSSCPSDCGSSTSNTSSSYTAPNTSSSCPSDCGSSTSDTSSSYTAPNTSSSCPSDCGSSTSDTSPSYTAPSPSTSYNDCSCNTVNLQSSTPISASGVNLAAVPVNAFGEFQVTVNVPQTTMHYTTQPTIWAINAYNDQPSNSAPMCICG